MWCSKKLENWHLKKNNKKVKKYSSVSLCTDDLHIFFFFFECRTDSYWRFRSGDSQWFGIFRRCQLPGFQAYQIVIIALYNSISGNSFCNLHTSLLLPSLLSEAYLRQCQISVTELLGHSTPNGVEFLRLGNDPSQNLIRICQVVTINKIR